MVTTTHQFQTTERVGGALSESEKMTVQPIPKPNATARNKTSRKFHGQRPDDRSE